MSSISITLEPSWDPIVSVGSKLTTVSALAQLTTQAPTSQTIPLARILAFDPSHIFKHIKKGVGSVIKKGEVVAQNKSLFHNKAYTADTDGMITHIDHVLGEIIFEQITPDESTSAIMALVEGVVSTVSPTTITVKVNKTLSVPVMQTVEDRFGGRTLITDDTRAQILDENSVAASVIVGTAFSTYTVSKCEALLALGFITATPHTTSLRSFTLKEPQTYTDIVDFAPENVYANAGEKELIFYK